jgi:hypothetical protein
MLQPVSRDGPAAPLAVQGHYGVRGLGGGEAKIREVRDQVERRIQEWLAEQDNGWLA